MNTYIQDKLDAIENDLKEKGYTKFERETIIDITKQSLTDYHNHIVEMFSENKQDYKLYDGNIITAITMPKIRELLQDTNQKE